MNWQDLTVMITGGTGSFGRKFTEIMLDRYKPKKLIIFSRDELKQHAMRQIWSDGGDNPRIRYFIGDVRDRERLYRATQQVDVIVHAAALKQVPACEYNPFEAVQTNILGAKNLIDAAIDNGVKKVLALSTDKAVNPVNLYGATKLAAEKLFVQGNAYAGSRETRFSCVRYGNVVGSRGSVIPLFREQAKSGVVSITDERMTRFWITLEQGVEFVIKAVESMNGAEVFVPRLPSMRVTDLAARLAPGCRVEITGIRPGEKVHETLISDEEARRTLDRGSLFVVLPAPEAGAELIGVGDRLPADFLYSSDTNSDWLQGQRLDAMLKEWDEA